MSRRKKSKPNIIASASPRSNPIQEKQDKKQKPAKTSRVAKLPDLPAGAIEAFDKLYALKIPEPVLWLERETEKQMRLVLDTQLDQDQENWDGTKYLKARFDTGLRVLIKFLAGIDAIGQDTWQKVGQTVSPEFIREVLLQKALGFIDAHEGIIKKRLDVLAPRVAVKDLGPVLRHLEASYGRLRNKMYRLYEIKAVELEHKDRLTSTVEGVASLPVAKNSRGNRGNVLASSRRDFVKPILEQKGWSELQFAQHAGVDYNTVIAFLKGQTKPRSSTRKQMADALDTNLVDFPR